MNTEGSETAQKIVGFSMMVVLLMVNVCSLLIVNI